jgi:hypothetical protein
MADRYQSKPSIIEAVKWNGDNWDEVVPFGGPESKVASTVIAGEDGYQAGLPLQLLAGKDGSQEWVPVPVGHWLVNQPGDKSDIWPVDPDYFAAKYEAVTDAE